MSGSQLSTWQSHSQWIHSVPSYACNLSYSVRGIVIKALFEGTHRFFDRLKFGTHLPCRGTSRRLHLWLDWQYLYFSSQIIFRSLDAYCNTKSNHPQWKTLLQEGTPQATENHIWNSYTSPMLAFKLYSVLSGSAMLKGKVTRTAMSYQLAQGLTRVVSLLFSVDYSYYYWSTVG